MAILPVTFAALVALRYRPESTMLMTLTTYFQEFHHDATINIPICLAGVLDARACDRAGGRQISAQTWTAERAVRAV
jgi:hypothetical protein